LFDLPLAAPLSLMAGAWSDLGERGAAWGVSLTAGVYRVLGRTACRIMLAPVVAYFYATDAARRRASRNYLDRAWRAGYLARRPGYLDGLRHFLTFAYASLDKFAAWNGDIRAQDVDGVHDGLFDEAKRNQRGAVVITAHIGSPEVIRAIATVTGRFRVNVLVHTLHAERFNRVIERVSPESPVRLIQVSQIDVAVAMRLSEAVARGEWVVIMGDRLAVAEGDMSAAGVDFLGGVAKFPAGPYVLAAALGCPAYTLFCTRQGKRFSVAFELFADPVLLPRRDRASAIQAYAAAFAHRLEKIVASDPFQWFNFYDYWMQDNAPPGGGDTQDLRREN
jgi:predicted LPLAT superfamily acyltransferase